MADYRAMNRNSKVVDARKRLAATFSTTAPKPVPKAVPVAMSYNRFGSNRIPDRELDTPTKVFGGVVKALLPNPSMIKQAVQDPSGTIRGAAEIASLTNPSSYVARASNLIQGKDLSLYGADMSDVEQAAELASLYPGGKTVSAPLKAGNALLRSKAGVEFYRPAAEMADRGIRQLNMGLNPDIGIKKVVDPEAARRSKASDKQFDIAVEDPTGMIAQKLTPEEQARAIEARVVRDQETRDAALQKESDWASALNEQRRRKALEDQRRVFEEREKARKKGNISGGTPLEGETSLVPQVNAAESPIKVAMDQIDNAEQIKAPLSGELRSRGSVPVVVDNVEDANKAFFGDNVVDTGRFGSSFTENMYPGSTIMIGKQIKPDTMVKHMIGVTRGAIKDRFGRSLGAIKNQAPQRMWAQRAHNNFETDFGSGSIRVMGMEGRRSASNEYDASSIIPQTIQHDHTVVSPSDLVEFENEVKNIPKYTEEYKEANRVLEDMKTVLKDARNLVPTHRNVNILFSSFDRRRLLNDPEYAKTLGIDEDNLGDIWRIMSAEGSGYRRSVDESFAWAEGLRKGEGKKSIDYYYNWLNNRGDAIIERRAGRLADAGIKVG